MKRALLVAFALLIASLAPAACGGSDDSSEGGAETQSENGAEAGGEAGGGGEAEGGTAGSAAVVDIEAAPGTDLAYTSAEATAQAGPVTVNFTNPQAIGHDVAIEDSAGESVGETDIVTEGSDSAKVDLEPGTYTFFCTVPGHREAGMEGTLTVK